VVSVKRMFPSLLNRIKKKAIGNIVLKKDTNFLPAMASH